MILTPVGVSFSEPQRYETVEVSSAQPSTNPDKEKTDFAMTENSAYGEHCAAPEAVVLEDDNASDTHNYDVPPE